MQPLDLSNELNKSADIVVKDIIDGVKRGSQFHKSFTPNAESTIKQKETSEPLIAQKKKFISKNTYKITKATKTKQSASIEIDDPTTAKIAAYNHIGTKKIPSRPFYGISETAGMKIDNMIEEEINKWADKTIVGMGFKKR